MCPSTSLNPLDHESGEVVHGLPPDQPHLAALQLLAHELCSPAQSLLASSEELITQPLDEGGRRALARIHRATQKILTQLNDLEALAHVQLGVQRPGCVSFEVGALLEEVAALDQVRHVGNLSRVAVRSPDAPIFVKGEAQLIQQALDRLIRMVLNGAAGKVMLSVAAAPSTDGLLSLHMQCLESSPWSSWTSTVADRLSLVCLIAGALRGELRVSDADPAGPSFELRVGVEVEDPDAVPQRTLSPDPS